MARITCAISGIRFQCSFLDNVSIPHKEGYFHPTFALPHEILHKLYDKHCNGDLNHTDSYLLFIAFLHSSNKIIWEHPANLNPNDSSTRQLVENNITQLIKVLAKSEMIKHPSFEQPKFKVTYETSLLHQIPNWIEAWEDNIAFFHRNSASIRQQQTLMEIENKFSYHINSGNSPDKYTHIIANWACEAASFPPLRAESFKKIIRSCFNINAMFNTDLDLIKEVKDYCECNIDAGSVHFHILSEVFNAGIARHKDYLGISSIGRGYDILPSPHSTVANKEKEKEIKSQLHDMATTANENEPVSKDYPDSISFLKAQLAFRLAKNLKKAEAKELEKNPDNVIQFKPNQSNTGKEDLL